MEWESDKYALDKEGRVTELKNCGIPVEQALINCGMGSQQGLLSAMAWLRILYVCVSVICTSETWQFVRHNTPPLLWLIYRTAVFMGGFEAEHTTKPRDLTMEAPEYEAFWIL